MTRLAPRLLINWHQWRKFKWLTTSEVLNPKTISFWIQRQVGSDLTSHVLFSRPCWPWKRHVTSCGIEISLSAFPLWPPPTRPHLRAFIHWHGIEQQSRSSLTLCDEHFIYLFIYFYFLNIDSILSLPYSGSVLCFTSVLFMYSVKKEKRNP